MLAHKELCERVEKKSTANDHKKGIEKITNIKNRKFKGVLATDASLLESTESRINAMEGILQDLESRQRFYNASITKETEIVFQYTGNNSFCRKDLNVYLRIIFNFICYHTHILEKNIISTFEFLDLMAGAISELTKTELAAGEGFIAVWKIVHHNITYKQH